MKIALGWTWESYEPEAIFIGSTNLWGLVRIKGWLFLIFEHNKITLIYEEAVMQYQEDLMECQEAIPECQA